MKEGIRSLDHEQLGRIVGGGDIPTLLESCVHQGKNGGYYNMYLSKTVVPVDGTSSTDVNMTASSGSLLHFLRQQQEAGNTQVAFKGNGGKTLTLNIKDAINGLG